MAAEYRKGDRVRIVIDDARVDKEDARWLNCLLVEGYRVKVPLDAEGVTVERLFPAEWPPRAGDLWRDRHGEVWFFHRNPFSKPGPELLGRTAGGARWTDDIPVLEVDGNAPWTLVRREGEVASDG
jgi:hypothetical protein